MGCLCVTLKKYMVRKMMFRPHLTSTETSQMKNHTLSVVRKLKKKRTLIRN